MAAILNSAILNLAILDSAILVFPLKLTHTCQDWFPPFAQKKLHSHFPPHHLHKKNFTHSFSLNLMMAAILNSTMLDSDTAILESDTFLSSLRFTQKHSPSTLTQSNSIWLTWWWLPSWILPSWIQPSWIQPSLFLLSNSLTLAKIGSHHLHKKTFTHSFWLNLMMAAILNSAILNLVILDSAIFVFSSQTHSHLPRLVPTICTKRPSLIHSDSTWWWQPSWILPCWIQTLPSWIQTPSYLLSDSNKNTLTPLWLKLIQSDSNSFILA